MSRAFILVMLAERNIFTFGDPILNWVKQKYPEVLVLDVDSYSDIFLVNQACALVEKADAAVVCFKALTSHIPLGSSFQILETILQQPEKVNLFLQGEHRQIEAICKARPTLAFQMIENEAALKDALENIRS